VTPTPSTPSTVLLLRSKGEKLRKEKREGVVILILLLFSSFITLIPSTFSLFRGMEEGRGGRGEKRGEEKGKEKKRGKMSGRHHSSSPRFESYLNSFPFKTALSEIKKKEKGNSEGKKSLFHLSLSAATQQETRHGMRCPPRDRHQGKKKRSQGKKRREGGK